MGKKREDKKKGKEERREGRGKGNSEERKKRWRIRRGKLGRGKIKRRIRRTETTWKIRKKLLSEIERSVGQDNRVEEEERRGRPQ